MKKSRIESTQPALASILSIQGLSKTYAGGREALKRVDLEIREGEIFALLGPNGAGKTTLINIVCGIVTPTQGKVAVGRHDIVRDWRAAREMIGLVPQELSITPFETVGQTVAFSRGLFGKPADGAKVDAVLKSLSLLDRKVSKIVALSGGMKRRVLIAKALAHEPKLLFLDEPTAGVDVELRQDMWQVVRELREAGVTIILTTHYIEEAELMADRVGVINKGELIVVEEKNELMRKMGQKRLILELDKPLSAIPPSLAAYNLSLANGGRELVYAYDNKADKSAIAELLERCRQGGIGYHDLQTQQSSLEDIFVGLVHGADR
jgi:ABC-2 type transport system ATP-binding protein